MYSKPLSPNDINRRKFILFGAVAKDVDNDNDDDETIKEQQQIQ